MEGYDYEAAARAIKIEDIVRSPINREILCKLKENDPNLVNVAVIGSLHDNIDLIDHNGLHEYHPEGAHDLGWVGYYIGKNTYLKKLQLANPFQYFDNAYGIEAAAFIVPGNGQSPGPARVKALRDHLAEHPAVCAFTAPQENEQLLRTALEGQATRVAVLDPLGVDGGSYASLLRGFADAMVGCFADKS